MKVAGIFILLFVLLSTSRAQELAWSLPFDSDGDDDVSVIAYANDKVYASGEYTGKIDIDPSSFKVELNVGKSKNAYVAIYTTSGDLTHGFCCANGDGYQIINGSSQHFEDGEVTVKDMEVDKAGNIYVVGYFMNTVDFNPQGETYALTSPEGTGYSPAYDGFVAKYSPSGVLLWMRHVSGNENDEVHTLELDNDNNVYFQGSFSASADFDAAGEGDVKVGTESNYGNNTFISKVSANNDYYYTRTMHSYNGSDAGRIFTNDFKVDPIRNVMYIAGHFSYKLYLDSNSEEVSLASNRSGKYSGFIAKYDLDGNFIWATEAVAGLASTIAKIYGIAIDPNGDILSVGEFGEGSISFNEGPIVASSVMSYAGHFALFSAATGDNMWGWAINEGSDYSKLFPRSIVVSPDNEIFVYGRYLETITFDVDNIETSLTVTQSSDGGIRKYDNIILEIDNKSVQHYLTSGGSGSDSPDGGLVLGDNKELYAGGTFAGEAMPYIQDVEDPFVFSLLSEGGFLSRFSDVQERSNAKSIITTSIGTIREDDLILSIPANTTVNALARVIVVSSSASFEFLDGTTTIDSNDTQIITPTFTIVVKAENETEKTYQLSLQTSELFSTAIGVLNNDINTISKIPENTLLGDFLGGLVYSAGGTAYIVSASMNPESLTDSSILTSTMVLYIANTDTTSYSLSLLKTGNDLLSSQVGRIVGDTIYCASGVDLYGLSKGIEVSEGALLSFYENEEKIITLSDKYVSSETMMHITSESGAIRIIQFIVVEDTENYILSTANGLLITITSEIRNLSSKLTVQTLLDGLTLSPGAVANVLQPVEDSFVMVDLDEVVNEDMQLQVVSLAGDVRNYKISSIVNGIYDLDMLSLQLTYSAASGELLLFANAPLFGQSLTIFDITGKECYRTMIKDLNTNLSFQINLKRGVYLVSIKGDVSQYTVTKISVN